MPYEPPPLDRHLLARTAEMLALPERICRHRDCRLNAASRRRTDKHLHAPATVRSPQAGSAGAPRCCWPARCPGLPFC